MSGLTSFIVILFLYSPISVQGAATDDGLCLSITSITDVDALKNLSQSGNNWLCRNRWKDLKPKIRRNMI